MKLCTGWSRAAQKSSEEVIGEKARSIFHRSTESGTEKSTDSVMDCSKILGLVKMQASLTGWGRGIPHFCFGI